jgi:hypothetical protein
MVTVIESLSDPPSESSTVTLTELEAGPSGKVQSKLPAPVVALNAAGPSSVPLAPQSTSSSTNVSAPGSEVVNV